MRRHETPSIDFRRTSRGGQKPCRLGRICPQPCCAGISTNAGGAFPPIGTLWVHFPILETSVSRLSKRLKPIMPALARDSASMHRSCASGHFEDAATLHFVQRYHYLTFVRFAGGRDHHGKCLCLHWVQWDQGELYGVTKYPDRRG